MHLRRDLAKKYLSLSHGFLPLGGASSLTPRSFAWNAHKIALNSALDESEKFDTADWHDIQSKKLRHILEHAEHLVPHWKKVFKEVGFDINHFNDRTEFKKIPISTRAQLKLIPLIERSAEGMPSFRIRATSTSGSTGEPFSLYQDTYESVSKEVSFPYEFRFAGAKLEKPMLILGLESHVQLNNWGRRFFNSTIQNENERKSQLYPYLTSQKPTSVRGTATLIRLLAEAMEHDGFSYKFQYIIYGSEKVDSPLRSYIERILGGRVFGSYGSRECSRIAWECEYRALHLQQWRNFVEILDDNDEPVLPGSEGRIILTNLEKEVMPFIRYEIGDRGKLSLNTCACGRTIPTISITGRIQGSILLPSGKKIPALAINTLIANTFQRFIQRFQIEDLPDKIILRFVPTDIWSAEVARGLQRRVSELLFGEKEVLLERIDTIKPNAAGKTPLLVRNY